MGVTLLVLAAGMGSRFGGLKQLDELGPNGESIIDYSIYDAIEAGIDKVVFVIRHEFEEDFKTKISNKYTNKIEVAFAYQELDNLPEGIAPVAGRTKPWGTGHAVWVAKDEIQESFVVINADDFYGRDSFQVITTYLKTLDPQELSQQAMVGFRLQNTLSENGEVSRGVCELNEADDLAGITERTAISYKPGKDKQVVYIENNTEYQLTGNEVVSMNMMGFTPAVFTKFEKDFLDFMARRATEEKSEFYLPTVLNNLVQNGDATAKVLKTSSVWFGVTYKEDKQIASGRINQLIKEGKYPSPLWSKL